VVQKLRHSYGAGFEGSCGGVGAGQVTRRRSKNISFRLVVWASSEMARPFFLAAV
jgi:hypothetical protein